MHDSLCSFVFLKAEVPQLGLLWELIFDVFCEILCIKQQINVSLVSTNGSLELTQSTAYYQ